MKNRYYYFKRLYKDFVIVIIKKGKRISFGIDKLLLPYLDTYDISYIEVNSNNKVKVYRMHPNKYRKYVMMISLKKVVDKIVSKEYIKSK